MTDNRVFEVREVVLKDANYVIGGLVFHTIKIGDKLIIGNQTMTQFCLLIVKDIVTYGRHIQEIPSGMTCRITVEVEGDCDVDFTMIRYLYKSREDDSEPFYGDPHYMDERVEYVLGRASISIANDQYRIIGSVYHPIKIGDKLTITNDPQADSPILVVKDIVNYLQGRVYHLDIAEPGLVVTIVVEKEQEIDFEKLRYLYKVKEKE